MGLNLLSDQVIVTYAWQVSKVLLDMNYADNRFNKLLFDYTSFE